MTTHLTLFYTHRLQGDLALLPRLYTFLERLRQGQGASLLVDLGESCTPSQWHCTATQGRSSIIVLDGMGYHAVNVEGILDAPSRSKLVGITTVALIHQGGAWRYDVPPVRDEGIVISLTPSPALRLCVVLSPADSTRLEEGCLYLQGIEGGQVGAVRVNIDEARLESFTVHDLPATIPAHPIISASIEFVEDEARHAQNRP